MLQHIIVERDLLSAAPLGVAAFPLLGDLAPIGTRLLVEGRARRLIFGELAPIFEHRGRGPTLRKELRQQLGLGIANGGRQRVGLAAARSGREQDEREWNQREMFSNRMMHAALLAGIR
ncbi:hypothetical protein ABIF63_001649 [Bradyrhizobium japonicum]|uniref:Uncharacterized protein n=1 Tax=Bradyrhizobium japonicum TaxID=375 RepID=A0ABV2RKS4_BRAJP